MELVGMLMTTTMPMMKMEGRESREEISIREHLGGKLISMKASVLRDVKVCGGQALDIKPGSTDEEILRAFEKKKTALGLNPQQMGVHIKATDEIEQENTEIQRADGNQRQETLSCQELSRSLDDFATGGRREVGRGDSPDGPDWSLLSTINFFSPSISFTGERNQLGLRKNFDSDELS
eukprot:753250-Hanusia_phi.AAC.2